jgi:dTDP-4-amino-4,6-dideoxygalactose transaminase
MINIHQPVVNGAEALEAVARVIESGQFVDSVEVSSLENRLRGFTGAKYSKAVNNGTSALKVALQASGIGFSAYGERCIDEVIVPSFTFIATPNSVMQVGAKPVFADVDEHFNLDPQSAENAITDRTKAIMPVGLYGQPCQVGRFLEIAQQYDLALVFDWAQSFGSQYKGKDVASYSHEGVRAITATSFYPTKAITTLGEGGAVFTNDGAAIETVRKIVSHGAGKPGDYNHEMVGDNYRMSEMSAAILSTQIDHVNEWQAIRERNAGIYLEELSGLPDIGLPRIMEETTRHAWTVFSILVNNGADEREALQSYLGKEGIRTGVYYPSICPETAPYSTSRSFPRSKALTEKVLALPVHANLGEEDIMRISTEIKSFYNGTARVLDVA